MEPYQIILIAVAATVFAAAVLVFAVALYADRLVFGRRQNRNVHLKYFEPSDFSLSVRLLPAALGKTPLYVAVYTRSPEEQFKKVVLFCPGMGAGQSSYMTEIARLASYGYAVVAYDSIGCGLSQGKNSRGFYAGVQSATAAYIAIKRDSALRDKPVCLVGHSWGAYTALCLTTVVAADCVVALSPFNTPVRTVADGGAPVIGGALSRLCMPMWYLINIFKFGFKGNANASRRVQKSCVPAFIAYGRRDKTVLPDNTPAYLAHGAFIQNEIFDNKGHNVYNTVAAQKLIEDISAAFSRIKSPQKLNEYFSKFDFAAATEEDEAVMNRIRFFIDSH